MIAELRKQISEIVFDVAANGGDEDYWTTEKCGHEIADRIMSLPEFEELYRSWSSLEYPDPE